MTPDTPATVQGLQLIYTNVEAEDSPTRQRGFQIWLCSPELTTEQRRAVAKRLDDFRLPPGVDPRDTGVVRHAYFRLGEGGLFVIARTVPSAERDKFGRGGKFHAHAVVLTDSAFRQLGYNPFRVIDGGFRFHDTPADARTTDRWRAGELPPAEVVPAQPSSDVVALPAARLGELASHIESGDEKPVVIANLPERVLAVFRGLFATFPPCLRRKAAFDTLSSSGPAGQTKYTLLGAYSAEYLRTWASRRYYQLDPLTGTCTPPLPAPATPLPGQLFLAPGWQSLGDAERDAAFATARALSMGKLDDLPSEELPPAVAEVLAGCAGLGPARERAIQARIERDLPVALARLPGVRDTVAAYSQAPEVSLKEFVARLKEPINRTVASKALINSLSQSHTPPAPAVLAGLRTWLDTNKPPIPELVLIFRRWRMSEKDLDTIEQFCARAREDAERVQWFRQWLTKTLAGASVAEFLTRLPLDGPASPQALGEARLWLASRGTPVSDEFGVLAVVVALHQGGDALGRALGGAESAAKAQEWLLNLTAERLSGQYTAGWARDEQGNTYLGLFVAVGQNTEQDLLRALGDQIGPQAGLRLLDALHPILTTDTTDPIPDTQPDLPPIAQRLYDKVLGCVSKDRAEAVKEFREYLSGADDATYELCANRLLDHIRGDSDLSVRTSQTCFTGLRLVWLEPSKQQTHHGLFEAIAGAAVDEVRLDRLPSTGATRCPRPDHRFRWLVTRLADPVRTRHLQLRPRRD